MRVVALDIGGTKIKGALMDKDLNIIKSLRIPSYATKGKVKFLSQLNVVIESLQPKKPVSLALSLPGFVDENGKVLFAGNALSFMVGFQLRSYLEKRFDVPVLIENDANCFTLAESYFGAGKHYDVVLGIIWGSGVGSGLVIKNQKTVHQVFDGTKTHSVLYSGSMELGHIPLLMESGKVQTLEKLIGGAQLIKKHKVHTVTELYETDKKTIKQVFKRFAQGLAITINLLSPQVVVIGGGVSKLPPAAFKEILELTKKYALPSHTKNLKIKRFEISDDAGLIGAAILGLKLKL